MAFDITSITTAVATGFIGWVLHGSIQFNINRKNIRAYLKIAINTHLEGIHNNYNIIDAHFKYRINMGGTVKIAPRHKADNLSSITTVTDKAIEYLPENEINRLAHLIFALQEMEDLVEGYCLHMKDYENKGEKLTEEQVKHLQTHLCRLETLSNQVPKSISSLQDLGREYHYKLDI